MRTAFPHTAAEVRDLGFRLVRHLRRSLKDTQNRKEWTARNFSALRSFTDHNYELQHFPPEGSRKGAFLWDYIAYQPYTGILIAAETEYERQSTKLTEDFDKLLYVRSPIKVFMFWLRKEEGTLEHIFSELEECMTSCSNYSSGELFILYCRTWANEDGSSGDFVRWLQIGGEPCHRGTDGNGFVPVPDQ